MRWVVEHLGKVLIATVAAGVIMLFLSIGLVSAVQRFVPTMMVGEQNYEDANALADSGGPVVPERVFVTVGGTADVFADGITTLESVDDDMMDVLRADYAKEMADRERVFIYRLQANGTNTLSDTIDTSSRGNWMVFYLVEDGDTDKFLNVKFLCRPET